MPRLSVVAAAALATVCGLMPLQAGAGVDDPFGPVEPLARAELDRVRGGFKVGAFEMNIGVSVRTGLNDKMTLTSSFVIEGLNRVRQIGDTIAEGLSPLNGASQAAGAGDTGTQPERQAASTASTTASARNAATAGSSTGPATVSRTSRPTSSGSSSGSSSAQAATQPSAAPAPSSNASATPVTGTLSIPGLTVSHGTNGLPRSIVLNRLNNVSISQRVQINLSIENFRDLIGSFRASRLAADAVRNARSLRGS
ncbi:hypothetical protein [Ferruginivarius sediminum]|uniref:Uncharacterized protein n=1 Tax=Ferruginivarius sediminum TaxID=2661937 RepID=A0A369TCB0_9PROT|nr:hypothetical protein [Ferruginivarius sediminum]RDD62981.1 hypothetical protein DRB17_04190 [Ferruginivarius sediminum]